MPPLLTTAAAEGADDSYLVTMTIVVFGCAALCFALFALSFRRDRRRLRNGVYLLAGLLLLGLGVVGVIAENSRIVADLTLVGAVALAASVVFAVAVFLVFNGVVMIRREGRRPANLLSLVLGVTILAFVPFTSLVSRIDWAPLRLAQEILAFVLAYLGFLFVGFLLYTVVYGRVRDRRDVDFIVVLGSGLLGSRVPPLLASRLDRAKTAFDAAERRGGVPTLITSGGQGPGEDLPESHAMAEYLVSKGVSRERILLEDRSTTTFENLTYSKAIMEGLRPDYRSTVVTNNFHALRAALIANRAKVNGQVVGSPTAAYFWPSATIREFVAVLAEHKALNGLVCAAIAVTVVWGELASQY